MSPRWLPASQEDASTRDSLDAIRKQAAVDVYDWDQLSADQKADRLHQRLQEVEGVTRTFVNLQLRFRQLVWATLLAAAGAFGAQLVKSYRVAIVPSPTVISTGAPSTAPDFVDKRPAQLARDGGRP